MIGAGSFGGWDITVFPVSSKQLDIAIDSLYKAFPRYVVPGKWKNYSEEWIKQGYVQRKTYVFYFEDYPEEMYYVSIVGPGYASHPEYARFSIRGVETGDGNWKEHKQYNDAESARIEKRFKEAIVSKLEEYTKTKSYIEE